MSETYRCKDRQGTVHVAREDQWREYGEPPVDETLCGEHNYMDRTSELVTCVGCLAEEGAEEC